MPVPFKEVTVPHTGPDFTTHSKFDDEFWIGYKRHLISLNQSPHTIRNKIHQPKRFGPILNTRDARELLSLSKGTQSHAMKALSAPAKYHGIYDIWLELIKRFQLKWEQRDNLDTFKRIFDNNEGTYTKYVIMDEELCS
jgi:hypothetical protein